MKKNIIFISIVIIIFPLILYFLIFHNGFSLDDSNWSNFGSYYGGVVSSLFASLSFIFLIYSYYDEKNKNYESEQDQLFFKYLDIAEKIYNKAYFELNGIQQTKAQVFSTFKQTNLKMGFYIEQTNSILRGLKKGHISPQQKNYYDNSYKPLIDSFYMSQNQVVIYCNHILHILKIVDQRMFTRRKEYYDLLFSIFSKDDLYTFIFTKNDIINKNSLLENIIIEKLGDIREYDNIILMLPKIKQFIEYDKEFA